MNNKALKVILSSTAALACALTFSASTFAYVLIGNSVTVEDFQFDIEGQTGLLVSLDGENYSQDITSDAVKEKIAGSVAAFNDKSFQGVTPKQINTQVDMTGGKVNFLYDDVDRATHTHSYKDAEENVDYIKLDLWFKALSTTTAASNFNLVLGEDTKIESTTETIDIYNTFTANGVTYSPTGANNKVTQAVKNAIRLGLFSEEDDALKIFEVTDQYDLGTTAIEGRTDSHDPAKNIMYNYYNAVHVLEPFTVAAPDGDAYDTISAYGTGTGAGWQGEYISKFDSNGIAKVTVYLWLEGWDADYLLDTTLEGSKIGATLEFALSQ